MSVLLGWTRYTTQIKEILYWCSLHAAEDEGVLFYFDTQYNGVRFSRQDGRWIHTKKRNAIQEKTRFTVLFSTQQPLNFSLKKNIPTDITSWVKVFSSSEVTVYEYKYTSDHPPLRWGLSEEEKELCLSLSRNVLSKEISERENESVMGIFPPRLKEKCGVGVALWTDGHLRGSWIENGYTLHKGIKKATLGAARDGRFKPLSKEELQCTRIEITVLSDLKISLSKIEYQNNIIYPEKGYYVLSYEEKKSGWYLPEVFNVKKFVDLADLKRSLIKQKTGIGNVPTENISLYIFEVDDFIESYSDSVVSLSGPLSVNKKTLHNNTLQVHIETVANWLHSLQEKNGNIPAVIDLTAGVIKEIDWPRLAFAGIAFAKLSILTKNKNYKAAAALALSFLKKHLFHSPVTLPRYTKILTCIYIAELAYDLNESSIFSDSIEHLFLEKEFPQEPLLLGNLCSLHAKCGSSNIKSVIETLGNTLREDFRDQVASGIEMSLATWAEFVRSFLSLDADFSREVAKWLLSQQHQDGSFPSSTISDFSYTRGTGKIAEVLALYAKEEVYRDSCFRAMRWLLQFQYSKNSLYFVPENHHPLAEGGIRHDYFNTELWIDSASHFIIAGCRLQNVNATHTKV